MNNEVTQDEYSVPQWIRDLKGAPGPGSTPEGRRRRKDRIRNEKIAGRFGIGPYGKHSRWNGKPKVGDIYSTKGVADFETARYDGIEDVLVTKVHKKHVEVCLVENIWSAGCWVQTVTDLYIEPENIKDRTFVQQEGIFICADVVGVIMFDSLKDCYGSDFGYPPSIDEGIVPLLYDGGSGLWPDEYQYDVGFPYHRSRLDPRWHLKEEQVDRIHVACSASTVRLLEKEERIDERLTRRSEDK